jgi:hypothetical protein
MAFIRDPLRRKANDSRCEIMQENAGLLRRQALVRRSRTVPFILPFGEHLLTHFNPPQDTGIDTCFTMLPRHDQVRRRILPEYPETIFIDKKYCNFPDAPSRHSYSTACLLDNYIVAAGRDRDHYIKIFR